MARILIADNYSGLRFDIVDTVAGGGQEARTAADGRKGFSILAQ